MIKDMGMEESYLTKVNQLIYTMKATLSEMNLREEENFNGSLGLDMKVN